MAVRLTGLPASLSRGVSHYRRIASAAFKTDTNDNSLKNLLSLKNMS
jgi:hypothetical protein